MTIWSDHNSHTTRQSASQPYDAIIFDSDGVLIEPTPETLVRPAIIETFESYGVTPSPSEVDELFDADHETVHEICAEYEIDPVEFWKTRDENVSRVQCTAIQSGRKQPYEDITEIPRLADTMPLGIVSNNQHQTIQFFLEHTELTPHFTAVYGRPPTIDSLTRKKPNPFYLNQALADLDATNPLFIGDSNGDIAAARAADIDSLYLSRSHRTEYTLQHQPTYQADSLSELASSLPEP